MPATSALALTARGVSACWREKASSRSVRACARCTPCSAISLARADSRGRRRIGQTAKLAVDRVEAAEHQRQHIIEIVRHSAGELAERLHLLRLTQVFLESPSLGDVASAHDHPTRFALARRNGGRDRLDHAGALRSFVAAAASLPQAFRQMPVDRSAHLRSKDILGSAPNDFVPGHPVEAKRRRVDLLVAEAAVLLDQDCVALRRMLEERADERLCGDQLRRPFVDPPLQRLVDLPQLLLRVFRLGDVVRHPDKADVFA